MVGRDTGVCGIGTQLVPGHIGMDALCVVYCLVGSFLQRIANHTRCGGPDKLCLERYSEALSDHSSGLTYPALTGARKQSVVDAERIFSLELAEFMKKGYSYEARYISTIWNWRRSCDERGLSELQRSRFNYQFLNLILELIPWYKGSLRFQPS